MNASSSPSDTYNARWISPESIAETFVPISALRQLVHDSHSLLLGARGCGKTTLLKMLTRRAQTAWDGSGRAVQFRQTFSRPRFEAVYIPSDVRWSFEVREIHETIQAWPDLIERTQRLMVAINGVFHFLGVIRDIVGERRDLEGKICELLIRRLLLKNTIASFTDMRCSLEEIGATIRGYISSANADVLRTYLAQSAQFLLGHALDPVSTVVRFVAEILPAEIRPTKWALCYDELEIAPEWLRSELVASLRSGPQDILLKLTWFPILPSGVPTAPNSTDDFRAIRLWHSHVEDPRSFCEELTSDFLKRRFGPQAPSPSQFFSRSILASEDEDEKTRKDTFPAPYDHDSTEWHSFRELAAWDGSFRKKLVHNGIDPNNPIPKNQKERDEFFRKVKPIVLLRNAFADESKKRSRKAPALYVGREAIYAMSEGNPRWLLALLTDLVDLGRRKSQPGGRASLSYASQGRILTNAAVRLRALIKSSPFNPPKRMSATGGHTLLGFVETLGNYFQSSLHNRAQFREEPIGSFEYPNEEPSVYTYMVSQLLEIGALVYVGSTAQDVPSSINGSRFRLSFMLAPLFRLPFRNLTPVTLREILIQEHDSKQLAFPFDNETLQN